MLSVKCVTVGDISSNCYFVYEKNNCVLIDPGANGELICEYAKELNVTIKHILLTHGHFDHIGAVEYVKRYYNCDVYININDALLLNDSTLNLSDRFGCAIKYDGDYISVSDEILNLIGYDFEFITTPGHTPGSMCIKVEDKLFTGDTLFFNSIGNAFPPYGNTHLEISSIKTKILILDNNIRCYPGHGAYTTILNEKQFNPYLI